MEIMRESLGRLLSGGSGLACVLGLGLFFVPWLEVTCQDMRLMTQTGYELVQGDGTIDDSLASLSEMGGPQAGPEVEKKDIEPEPIVAAFPIGMTVAGLLSLMMAIGILRGRAAATLATLGALAALVPIGYGLTAGFWVERDLEKTMEKERPGATPSGDPRMEEVGEKMGEAMAKAFRVRFTTVYYLEGLLAVLVVVLVNVAGRMTGDPPRRPGRRRRR
jgi:hypothetical protein